MLFLGPIVITKAQTHGPGRSIPIFRVKFNTTWLSVRPTYKLRFTHNINKTKNAQERWWGGIKIVKPKNESEKRLASFLVKTRDLNAKRP